MPRKVKPMTPHDEKTMDEILRICLVAHNSIPNTGAWEEVAKEQNKIAVFLCDSLERCMHQVIELEKVVHGVHENILLHQEKSMQEVAQVSAQAFKTLCQKKEKKSVMSIEESMAVEERAWGEVARLAATAHKFSKRLHAKELQVKLDLQDHHREMLKLQHDKQATQERHALMIIEMYKKEAEVKEMRNLLDKATEDKQHLGQRYMEKIKVLQAKLQDHTEQKNSEPSTVMTKRQTSVEDDQQKQDVLGKVENRVEYYQAKARKNAWDMWRNDTLYARWERTTEKHISMVIRVVLYTAKSNSAAKGTAWRVWKQWAMRAMRKPLSYAVQRKVWAVWSRRGAVSKDKMLQLQAKNKRAVWRAWNMFCAMSARNASLQIKAQKQASTLHKRAAFSAWKIGQEWQRGMESMMQEARAQKQVSTLRKREAFNAWKIRQEWQHAMDIYRKSRMQKIKKRAFRTWVEDYVFFARNVATHAMMLLRSWVAAVCFECGWTVPSNEDETMFMYDGMDSSLRWMVGMQMTTHLTTLLFQRLQSSLELLSVTGFCAQGAGIDPHRAGFIIGQWLGSGVNTEQNAEQILCIVKGFVVIIFGDSGHLARAMRIIGQNSCVS